MIVTISGRPSSGKSCVAKQLAKELGYRHFSAGDMQRQIAKEMGLTILELGILEQKDDSFDRKIDAKTRGLGEREDNFVIDSWLAPHFIPKAFHVFLDCDEGERIDRRIGQKREEETLQEYEKAKQSLRKREDANSERWMRYYHYNYMDRKNYDLILDTTKLSVSEVVQRIIQSLPK